MRGSGTARALAERRPFVFCALLSAALFGLVLAGRETSPTRVVGSVEDLAPAQLAEPSTWDQLLTAVRSAEGLYWLLAILLATALLTYFGWWRQAGFRSPNNRNLPLLWFPVLVGALSLSGGFQISGTGYLLSALFGALAVAIGEETIFRGLMLPILAPRGIIGAVTLTSLLAGTLALSRSLTDGPWPEAILISLLTACGGFLYGALRWRLASLWPVIALHFALSFIEDVAAPGLLSYLALFLLGTLGFIVYGLILLRNRRVRENGG